MAGSGKRGEITDCEPTIKAPKAMSACTEMHFVTADFGRRLPRDEPANGRMRAISMVLWDRSARSSVRSEQEPDAPLHALAANRAIGGNDRGLAAIGDAK